MKKNICEFIKLSLLGMLAVTFVFMLNVCKSNAAGLDIAKADLSQGTVWLTNDLDTSTGNELINKRRVHTEAYVMNDAVYQISINNAECKLTAFLYDANQNFIKSVVLYNGEMLEKEGNATFIRFSLSYPSREKSMSLGQWYSVIGSSLKIEVIPFANQDAEAEETEQISYEKFAGYESTSYKDWVTGYLGTDGTVTVNKRRLVNEEYFPVYMQTLRIRISRTDVKLRVCEYDADKNFLSYKTLAGGKSLTVSENTRFVRFAIYKTVDEKSMSLGQWNALFTEDLVVKVLPKDAPAATTPAPEPIPEPVPEPTPAPEPIPEEKPVVKEEPSSLYDEIKMMLYTGDMTVHDISNYKATITQVSEAFNTLINGEGSLYYACGRNLYISNLNADSNRICSTMQIMGMDADFVARYSKMEAAVNEIKAIIQPGMSDLEKVLVIHDYLIEHAVYDKDTYFAGTAGGILGEGRGKCNGFAYAMTAVLNEYGIKSYYVSSDGMNHGWNYVIINGQPYHVDCTYDNTTEESTGLIGHEYLMASDSRFSQYIPRRHYDWKTSSISAPDYATSTKYDDWFVHDVKGKMLYSNGYWFFADGKTIKKSNIEGTDMSTVLTESGNVCIISLSRGVLTYSVNGITKVINI